MIAGACIGLVTGPLAMGWHRYPWIAVPFAAVSVVVLHPLMDRDVPNLVDVDVLKSARTYIAIALNIAAVILARPYTEAFQRRILGGQ